jgi:hypothetical protein
VKVRVLWEIRDKYLMPKWADLWHELNKCQGKSPRGASQILRQPLIQIDVHDYALIAGRIFRGKAFEGSGRIPQKGISAADFVEEVRRLLRKYNENV